MSDKFFLLIVSICFQWNMYASANVLPADDNGICLDTCACIIDTSVVGIRYPIIDFDNQTIINYDPSQLINMVDFGALGDGVTNNATIFQDVTNTGKILFIPDGDFYVSAAIQIAIGIYGSGHVIRRPRRIQVTK